MSASATAPAVRATDVLDTVKIGLGVLKAVASSASVPGGQALGDGLLQIIAIAEVRSHSLRRLRTTPHITLQAMHSNRKKREALATRVEDISDFLRRALERDQNVSDGFKLSFEHLSR